MFVLVGGARDAPAHADFRLRGRVRTLGSHLMRGVVRGLRGGLVIGLVFGLGSVLFVGVGSTGLLVGILTWLVTLLVVTVGIALVFGLPVGLVSFVDSPSIARRATSPAESLRGDRRLTALASGMFSLLGGALIGLVSLETALKLDAHFVPVAVGIGVLFGLVLGQALGLALISTCTPAFVVALLRQGTRRRLPLRLMDFLDDAYRLGLLRIVGPVYQFRHAALQDHLAPPADVTASAAGAGLRAGRTRRP